MTNEFKDRWKVDFKLEDFKSIVNAEPIPDAMSEYVTQSARTLSEHINKEETKLILSNLDFNSLETLYFQIKEEFYSRIKDEKWRQGWRQ